MIEIFEFSVLKGVLGNRDLHSQLSRMQTDATLLDVSCCVRLHTLLHVLRCCVVVGSCRAKFETGNTFKPTTPKISFVL